MSYANEYANTVSQLLSEIGRARAQQSLQTGQAWGGALQNIGQTIAAIPGQQQAQQRNAQDAQLRGLQIKDAQNTVDAQDLKKKNDMVLADAYNGALGPDGTLDRTKLQTNLATLHLGAQIPQIFKTLDDADEANAKAQKARTDAKDAAAKADASELDYAKTLGEQMKAADYSPAIVNGLLTVAKAHGHNVDQFQQLFDQSPTQFKTFVDKLTAPDDKTAAEIAASQASTAKTKAETAGTLPMTPAQKLEADQRAAQIAHETATLDETHRHNLASESAANPLAALGMAGGAASAGNTQTPAQAPGQAPGQGLTGDDLLKTLPPGIATQVKSYAEGRQAFPSGMALRAPYFQSMLQLVGQYDPTFDATNFNGRNKARQDFTAGASAKQITALNTVIGHLDDLGQKADALNGGSVPAINALKNWLKSQTGSQDVSNFNTVKKGVTDELTRVWRQAGGSEADIKAWGENLSASSSPAQLRGQLNTIAGMLGSRLDALENQKQQGLGAFGNDISVITPKSKAIMDKLESTGPVIEQWDLVNGKLVKRAPK